MRYSSVRSMRDAKSTQATVATDFLSCGSLSATILFSEMQSAKILLDKRSSKISMSKLWQVLQSTSNDSIKLHSLTCK